MAILGTFVQQPNERLDYDIDFSEWIAAGDLVVSATSTADAGIVIELPIVDGTGKIVKQWVSGGTSGTTYKVQVRATTDDGRIKEAEFRVKVKEY